MAITSYTVQRSGTITTVTVQSDLEGTVHYFWYVDGSFVGRSLGTRRSFSLAVDEQAEIEVLDSIDPEFDAVANAPEGFPARHTLRWVRSTDDDVALYRVEQKAGAGEWTQIGTVTHTGWEHSFLTGRLDDLTDYEWRVWPVDKAGNVGTEIAVEARRVVRTPDAPDFTAAFNPVLKKMTFAEA